MRHVPAQGQIPYHAQAHCGCHGNDVRHHARPVHFRVLQLPVSVDVLSGCQQDAAGRDLHLDGHKQHGGQGHHAAVRPGLSNQRVPRDLRLHRLPYRAPEQSLPLAPRTFISNNNDNGIGTQCYQHHHRV